MRVLILNHSFRMFAGSEINALQLCLGLRAMGHDAGIGTFETENPMRGYATAQGVDVLELLADDDAPLSYDVIWAHHAPVLTHVLFRKKVADCRIVFSSLSPLTPLESPPPFFRDLHCLIAHSPKNQKYLRTQGALPERIQFFPNFAPEGFFLRTKADPSPRLSRIAVVSNHPPAEVQMMARIAKQNGIAVEFIGAAGKHVYVHERRLLAYDLVVSIGKTAQYCFAQKIPFYCYDCFGGPGYLTPENFALAAEGNFCGRSFWRKITGAEMYQEICDRYVANLGHLPYFRRQAEDAYRLTKNLPELWHRIQALPVTDIAAFRQRHDIPGRLNDVYIEALRARLRVESNLGWRLLEPLRRLNRRIRSR